MSHKYHKISKFSNQHCYYCHVTGQIFTEVVLNTFSEQTKESFGLLEKFDSLLEARVYAALKIFEAQTNASNLNIKAVITRQFPIEVKPKTTMFNAIIYQADFRFDLVDVKDKISPLTFFIEAKGIETPEYRLKMKFLEYCKPEEFHAILQVTNERKPSSIVPSISLKGLQKLLMKLVWMYFNLRMIPEEQLDNSEQIFDSLLEKIVNSEFN